MTVNNLRYIKLVEEKRSNLDEYVDKNQIDIIGNQQSTDFFSDIETILKIPKIKNIIKDNGETDIRLIGIEICVGNGFAPKKYGILNDVLIVTTDVKELVKIGMQMYNYPIIKRDSSNKWILYTTSIKKYCDIGFEIKLRKLSFWESLFN